MWGLIDKMNPAIPVSHQAARKVLEAARALLSGSIGIIEAARQIAGTRLYADDIEQLRDEDYVTFVGIDSETDHLPLGQIRQHWCVEALGQKDREIRAYEEFYRAAAVVAAKNLVAKLEGHAQQG